MVLETPAAGNGAPASVEQAAGAGDCDNPCRTVPYLPKTQMEQDILAAWQKTKMLEWKPDAAQWASFIADEFQIMLDEQDAQAVGAHELEQNLADEAAFGSGEAGGGLVHQQHARFHRQDHREFERLLRTMGEMLHGGAEL